jgi:sterol desaturase/sphingolipid hydroxylase (fatty acid hydroxylase superfamily)
MFATAVAAFAFFFVADLVYVADHYLVHHDRARYKVTHGRHHRRYNGKKDGPQLNEYEFSTYSSAALVSILGMSVVSLLTGNAGFFLGAVLKYVHSLVFHCYQHGWWGPTPLRKQGLRAPTRSWGMASARYHAFHHSNPDEPLFTYAESWAGFDRILEALHPWLVRFTVDGVSHSRSRALLTDDAGADEGEEQEQTA